ncbi:DUF4293 domain-containing protein [Fulvivirga imtechensis]|nr:DUF4293 domain-containing protein [Fulvivirga imtechensis]
MLQRIQTVFLLLVVLLMLVMLILPLWTYQSEDAGTIYLLTSFYLDAKEGTALAERIYFPYAFVAVLAIAAAIVGVIEIAKFKNRLLQMKLGALNSLFMAGAMGLGLYFASEIMDEKQLKYGWNYGMGVFFPAAAMICNVIANRFIRKDEKLVRSVDRIR